MPSSSNELRPLAGHAADFVTDGMVVGLGTGHAAIAFIHALGERVRAGLKVAGVPTSRGSERLAIELGIPLTTLDDIAAIDIDFDGADEVDPRGNLIKGYGGALLREKIIAAASRQIVILVGEEKLVPALGSHGKLPVEVTPFALGFCQRRLEALGFPSQPRLHDGQIFTTDNSNHILDCAVPQLDRPADAERSIRGIPGVVETGLFLGMGPRVLIQRGTVLEERTFGQEPSA